MKTLKPGFVFLVQMRGLDGRADILIVETILVCLAESDSPHVRWGKGDIGGFFAETAVATLVAGTSKW